MSGYNSPVDQPPGKDGYQGQNPETPVGDVPEWPPGANPPGTNPPVNPSKDPATNPVPGSIPGVGPPDPDAPAPASEASPSATRAEDKPAAHPAPADKAKHDKR